MASTDAWITSYSNTEHLGQEIMEKISQYHEELARNSPKAPGMATSIRTLMKKFSSSHQNLKQALVKSTAQGTLNIVEGNRRQGMVDSLATTEKRLEQAFAAKTTAAQNRSTLLGNTAPLGYGTPAQRNPWLADDESEESRAMPTDTIRNQHQQILNEQDRGLDALSKIVGRQREIAVDIAAEVEVHNDILDDIGGQMDHAEVKLARESRNIKVILRKSRTHWCLWLLIAALLVAIIVVIAVPRK